jgi:hypothetical protein
VPDTVPQASRAEIVSAPGKGPARGKTATTKQGAGKTATTKQGAGKTGTSTTRKHATTVGSRVAGPHAPTTGSRAAPAKKKKRVVNP